MTNSAKPTSCLAFAANTLLRANGERIFCARCGAVRRDSDTACALLLPPHSSADDRLRGRSHPRAYSDLLPNALGKPSPYSSCLSPRNRCRREVRSFGEARHCGEVEISPRFPSQLWTLAYFHAYLGYEFTHKLGIETDPVRIIGVSFTHNRGTRLPYPIAEKRFAPSPVLPVANPYIYQPVVSARKVEIAPDSPTDQRGPVKSENLRPVGKR
jgi:hypothetical protein